MKKNILSAIAMIGFCFQAQASEDEFNCLLDYAKKNGINLILEFNKACPKEIMNTLRESTFFGGSKELDYFTLFKFIVSDDKCWNKFTNKLEASNCSNN
jgi:hypothetical protein